MRTRCIIFFAVATLTLAGPAFANVIIIAHPSVPTDTVSQGDLEEIFLGKRTKWKDNSKIHCVIAEKSKGHSQFLKIYLHKSSTQFEMHWRNMMFTGQGHKPPSMASVQKVIDYVAATPGAIGYVDSLPDKANVKILTIK